MRTPHSKPGRLLQGASPNHALLTHPLAALPLSNSAVRIPALSTPRVAKDPVFQEASSVQTVPGNTAVLMKCWQCGELVQTALWVKS